MKGDLVETGERGLELIGAKVLVVGLARTGAAVARFLLEKGALVTVTDQKGEETFGEIVRELEGRGCRMRFGRHVREDFVHADLIVISPGVPLSMPRVQEAMRAGIDVISEVELASRFLASPLIAVTGTNGKTTTVSLIGEMLHQGGINAFVGGNIGRPLIECVLETEAHFRPNPMFVVAELSSFQLEGITQFRPWVGILLNVSEDHLDRYPSMDAYVQAKVRIFENQTQEEYAVIPTYEPLAGQVLDGIPSRKIHFSTSEDPHAEIFCKEGSIRFLWQEKEEVYSTSRMRLVGMHNLENMMAAVVAARLCEVSPHAVQEVLETFPGLEHRLERVCEVKGVGFYNDSKGTTVASVKRALEAFSQPILLIGGGKDKGGDFSQLRSHMQGHVKRLFLLGEARDRMAKELAGSTEIEKVSTMEEAVRQAWKDAAPGDVVLLSPACSSFDMYQDYEDRGRHYKKIIKEII